VSLARILLLDAPAMATTTLHRDPQPGKTSHRHGFSRFAMPEVPLDAGDRWIARSVCFVAIGVGAGMLASFVQNWLGGHALRTFAAVMAIELAVLATVLWLNRRGAPQVAARVLALSLPLLASSFMLMSGQGFRDVAVLMLPASLILSGLLLDRVTLVAATGLTLACSSGVLLAESQGLLAVARQRNAISDVFDAGVILVVTGLGVGLVAGRLRESHERLRSQEAKLRESEARYRGLVDLAADAIVVSTSETRLVEANHRASELFGYSREELLSISLERLFSPEELRRVPFRYDLADQGQIVVVERRLARKNGVEVPVEMSSRRMPDGKYQTILRDVSERHRAERERAALEARLRQSQKMEAVGRLAGGVAHDFNNLLTAITGSLALALRDVDPGNRAHRWLTETDKAAWRAAALTHQLLAFSRQQVIAPRVLDLRAVVEGAGSMLSRMIGEDVTLRILVSAEPCMVEVDQGQLEQVLLNLAANARDAMPDGGTLAIEVSRSKGTLAHTGRASRGPSVVMTVTDTGHGMNDDVQARIFEPFFTTKPAGSGTGLGLAMVYGAVEQNGGSIDVVSKPGRGSTFRIHLPEKRGQQAARPELQTDLPRGSETVLLVEDEAAVREVTREQLESLGYRVLSCADAAEALAACAGRADPLHLLLTDVVMPGMNGRELAERLTQGRPGLRVLYTSGYGEDVIARHGVLEPGVLLLQKPYPLTKLAGLVRTALAG
jgi:two-component system, cell cycle sensor histidine kinase and response regulator CckA